MTADDDMLHLQDIDGKLHNRETIEIGMDDDVGDVPVNKKLAGGKSHEFLRRYPAVGATDPEVFRLLLNGKILEKLGIPRTEILSPSLVV
jgi:hypothetical protein